MFPRPAYQNGVAAVTRSPMRSVPDLTMDAQSGTSEAAPLSPYRVVWELMHVVDRAHTVLTHDAGHPRDQIVPFYESVVPRGYP